MPNVIVVKKGIKKEKLQDRLKTLETGKKFPASKFCGKISIQEDPLKIQERLRDEWQ